MLNDSRQLPPRFVFDFASMIHLHVIQQDPIMSAAITSGSEVFLLPPNFLRRTDLKQTT
jgi:hypothetical protein